MRTNLCILLFCLCPMVAHAQRLPGGVYPQHYDIRLSPDLVTGELQGEENIAVDLATPATSITLNSVDLNITRAEFVSGEKRWKAAPEIWKEKEMVNLKFDSPLPAARGNLKIDFAGRVRTDLKGLYLIRNDGHVYAATQFEGTYARMMFPCFDEPQFKATFDLTVDADRTGTAISNGPIASDTPVTGTNKHTIRFATSPKMSTYLLALAIGKFECLEDRIDNIPVRVCAVPEKKELGKFALNAAGHFLHFYNRWYGIKYPYRKLDMVAIPDYEWGGMENTASIFYRESALLIDEKTASVSAKRGVAGVVAHELSHQWFGDLVTMTWWNNIWLNEGFATWITFKPLQVWDPNWDQSVEESDSTAAALAVDSLQSTRPIRAEAETPAEIKEMFDGIAYEKAGAVLRMLENYVGQETFRSAVNAYITRHANGNATAEDFWLEVAHVSKKPADAIMLSFVDQPGAPLVTAKQSCNGGKGRLELYQQRFFTGVKEMQVESTEIWKIPVCMRSVDAKSTTEKCELLTERSKTLSFDGCAPVLMNAGGRGYYRVAYDPGTLARLSASAEKLLTPAELLPLLNDQWALVRSGRVGINDYLNLTGSLKHDTNYAVMLTLIAQLQTINRIFSDDPYQQKYQSWFLEWLQPLTRELGLEAGPKDSDDRKALRSAVFAARADLDDLDAVAQAKEIVRKYKENPASTDPSMVNAAFHIAASHGDARLFDELLASLKGSQSPEAYSRYLFSLTSFRDPSLAQRAIDYSMSSSMRGQDMPGFFSRLLRGKNRDLTWKFLKDHWPELHTKVVSFGGGGVVTALGDVCDSLMLDDVERFFNMNRAPGAERAIKQTLENINNCIEFRKSQESNLHEWLNTQY